MAEEAGTREMNHIKPTPGDTYCSNCGLDERFWGKLLSCPAFEKDENEPSESKIKVLIERGIE